MSIENVTDAKTIYDLSLENNIILKAIIMWSFVTVVCEKDIKNVVRCIW